jgi:signal transduction histidine kinase
VLLVDDEFEVLTVLEALLEDDWEVMTAPGGAEALEILNARGDIDLVITDQRMPEMTGVELLSIISEQLPDVYRIVLTAYSDVEPIVAAINEGSVDQFVLKPWDPLSLRAQVEEGLAVCTRRQTMRAVASFLANQHQDMNRTLSRLKHTQERALAMERMALLGWMSTGLTKELHPLLVELRSSLEPMLAPGATPEASSKTGAVLHSLDRVRALLSDMERLNQAQPRAIETEAIAPRKLISDAVRLLLEEGAEERAVHVQIDPGLDTVVLDPITVRQALLNLLRNAAKASAPDTPIRVSVHTEAQGMVRFDITDQGEGMEPEVLQRATTPFFSAFEPPQHGLGLAICALVAEAHGGRLALLDNSPSGITAQLWLRVGEAA